MNVYIIIVFSFGFLYFEFLGGIFLFLWTLEVFKMLLALCSYYFPVYITLFCWIGLMHVTIEEMNKELYMKRNIFLHLFQTGTH